MSEMLTKASFDPHLKSLFQVMTGAHGSVPAELVEISDHSRENTETFSLLFKVQKEKFFDQKIYRLEHQKMGTVELFLTPVVHRDQTALYYEAIFNRIKEKK